MQVPDGDTPVFHQAAGVQQYKGMVIYGQKKERKRIR